VVVVPVVLEVVVVVVPEVVVVVPVVLEVVVVLVPVVVVVPLHTAKQAAMVG